jgi:hypothetical protein
MLREAGEFHSSSATLHSYAVLVRRFATDVVGPKVREMDENEQMDPAIIKGLFEQGVRDPVYPVSRHLSIDMFSSSWASKPA